MAKTAARAHFPVRHHSAHHLGANEWERLEARAQAAHRGAEPLHRRRVRRAADHQGRRRAEHLVKTCADYRPQCDGLEAAARHLVPHHRDRPGARQERRVLRARGQPALSFGRQLRARESPGAEAHVPAQSSRACRCGRSTTIRCGCSRRCATWRPIAVSGSARRGAHAGPLQQRVLRARLPGAADGRRAGRAAGPASCATASCRCARRRGSQRVDVIYRRVSDDFLDPLAFGRTRCSACPASSSVYLKGRVALANAPGTGVADDKAIYRYVEQHHQILPRPGCRSSPTCRPTCARDDADRALRARPPGRAGRQGDRRRGRLRHAGRPALDRRRACATSPSGSGAIRAATSRSLRCRCRACRPSSATSIEGRHVDLRPYVLYGRDITCSPAG